MVQRMQVWLGITVESNFPVLGFQFFSHDKILKRKMLPVPVPLLQKRTGQERGMKPRKNTILFPCASFVWLMTELQ